MTKFHLSTLILALLSLSLSGQTVSTWLTNVGITDDMIFDDEGNIYGSGFADGNVYKVDINGNAEIYASGIQNPNGLVLDDEGNLFVADWGQGSILKVDATGNKTPIITGLNTASGLQRMLNADTLLVSNPNQRRIDKVAFDGTLVPFINDNQLNGPVGIEYNENNELMLANFNDGRIFRYTSGQPLELIANIAVPNTGFGFIECIGDFIYATLINANKIYRADYDGNFLLIAGTGGNGSNDGAGEAATLAFPNGILASRGGDSLYVSDFGTGSVRVITDLDVTSSVKEVLPTVLTQLQVAPNPAREYIHLRFEVREPLANLSLQIIDLSGREITNTPLQKRINVGTYQQTVQLPTNILKGNYFYQIRNESIVLAGGKLLVQ